MGAKGSPSRGGENRVRARVLNPITFRFNSIRILITSRLPMNTKALLSSVIISAGLLFTTSLSAQTKLDFPSPSPLGSLKQRVGLTDIEITYSRPSAKG